MREYGKVYSTFWSSATIGGLSDDGKILALYLMTCSHSTIAGVFRLPDGYVSEDLGWVTERVREGFAELFAKGFANRCETTKWVWVRKHLEWNKPENPNQRKSAAKIAAGIPRDCCWGPEFSRTCDDLLGVEGREPWNPCGTVSKPLLNQEQKQEQEQKTEPPIPPKGGKAGAIGLKSWLEAIKAKGEQPIPEGDPVFAYADEVGLTRDLLRLAWLEFRHRYSQPDAKRYRDWRAVFRKAVRGNWLKLWFIDGEGAYHLTTVGHQAQRAHEERRAA